MEEFLQNLLKSIVVRIHMDEKEKQVQKALGTFPKFICDQCREEFFVDEKFIYTYTGTRMQLCTICATALFACNKILKKPMGKFTKEDD